MKQVPNLPVKVKVLFHFRFRWTDWLYCGACWERHSSYQWGTSTG